MNFDDNINRRETNSYKWNVGKNELPMWVADMDFDTAPEIKKAIVDRANKGVYGYNIVTDDFKNSYIKWWERRHQVKMYSEWLIFCTGVVPAISSMVRKLTKIGDNVVVLTPVYNIFFNSILNNQRKVLESDLIYDNEQYQIDFNDLEKKLSISSTSLMILCNPHNPTGQLFSLDELELIGQLCIKYNVILISDEIHCDLTHPDYKYTSILATSKDVQDNVVVCLSASKAFNIAGLQSSVVVVPNNKIRALVERGLNTDEVAEPNTFALVATEAAFDKSENWLNQLNIYLDKNRKFLEREIQNRLPDINIVKSQATYLLWLDVSNVTSSSTDLVKFIREKTGLILSPGNIYRGNGNNFIRWNYATTIENVIDGLERFEKAVKMYVNKNLLESN